MKKGRPADCYTSVFRREYTVYVYASARERGPCLIALLTVLNPLPSIYYSICIRPPPKAMGQTDKTRRRTPPRLTLSRNRVARTTLSSTCLEPAQFIGTVYGTRSPYPSLLDVFKTKHAKDLIIVTPKKNPFFCVHRTYIQGKNRRISRRSILPIFKSNHPTTITTTTTMLQRSEITSVVFEQRSQTAVSHTRVLLY